MLSSYLIVANWPATERGTCPQAMPETDTIKEAFDPHAKALRMTWDQFTESLAVRTHPGRLMTLEETADVAVFMGPAK